MKNIEDLLISQLNITNKLLNELSELKEKATNKLFKLEQEFDNTNNSINKLKLEEEIKLIKDIFKF